MGKIKLTLAAPDDTLRSYEVCAISLCKKQNFIFKMIAFKSQFQPCVPLHCIKSELPVA